MAHNVTHEIKGDKLVITIDISASSIIQAPPSSSGKTKVVGMSGGFVKLGTIHNRELAYSLNVTAA